MCKILKLKTQILKKWKTQTQTQTFEYFWVHMSASTFKVVYAYQNHHVVVLESLLALNTTPKTYFTGYILKQEQDLERIKNLMWFIDHGLQFFVELFGNAERLDHFFDQFLILFDGLELVVQYFEHTALFNNSIEFAAVEANIGLLGALMDPLTEWFLLKIWQVLSLEHVVECCFFVGAKQNMATFLLAH